MCVIAAGESLTIYISAFSSWNQSNQFKDGEAVVLQLVEASACETSLTIQAAQFEILE